MNTPRGDALDIQIHGLNYSLGIPDLLSQNTNRFYSAYYNRTSRSGLNHLADKYGTDKGGFKTEGNPYPWGSHAYCDYYENLFSHCRHTVTKVFELGLGTNNPALASSMGIHGKVGASLRMWREYFPNAHIYGADIDQNILFNEERISTYYCDQTNETIISGMWNSIGVSDYDLIIEDGLHTFEAQRIFFENSFSHLREGGIYIIEDVLNADLVPWVRYFSEKQHHVDFIRLYKNSAEVNSGLIVIRNDC